MPGLLSLDDVFENLVKNQRKFRNPLGLSMERLTDWSKGLTFDNSSDTYLYTGGLYQMVPYINSLVDGINKLEGSMPGGLGMARMLERLGFNISSFYSSITAKDTARYNRIVSNLYAMLRRQGISFGYLADDEIYSGVILYDMGLDDEFGETARLLASKFKDRRISRLITMDPHSTFLLRDVYPKYVEAFDVEVVHYMELVEFENLKKNESQEKFSIHDPCLLARNLDLSQKYRDVATAIGLDISEPQRSGRQTFCCGGPIENIAPKVSSSIAENRCSQLRRVGDKAIVACPICLSNLGRACKGGMKVYDILELI